MNSAREDNSRFMQLSYSIMLNTTGTTHTQTSGWCVPTALQLGRISNLPTVFSNVLAAIAISGGTPSALSCAALFAAMALAYIGGMFLNDAFDHKHDAVYRPERPIPLGKVPRSEVLNAGFTLLVLCIALVAFVATAEATLWPAMTSASLLCGAIVLYDLWHKNNPISPLIMGACRALVYLTCGFGVTLSPTPSLYWAALILLSYVIGLTYSAKQENRTTVSAYWPLLFLLAPVVFGLLNAHHSAWVWVCTAVVALWTLVCLRWVNRREPGDVPRAVVSMIAGISLVDALVIATSFQTQPTAPAIQALMLAGCFLAFGLTLYLQRHVSGT